MVSKFMFIFSGVKELRLAFDIYTFFGPRTAEHCQVVKGCVDDCVPCSYMYNTIPVGDFCFLSSEHLLIDYLID